MFSKYNQTLKAYWQADSLHEALKKMRNCKKGSFEYQYHVLQDHHILTDSVITHNEYFTDNRYVYQCIANYSLMQVIKWINENIILNIDNEFYKSIDVKTRIATGMLNKLVKEKKLSHDHALVAHDILIANLRSIRNELTDEDLPF